MEVHDNNLGQMDDLLKRHRQIKVQFGNLFLERLPNYGCTKKEICFSGHLSSEGKTVTAAFLDKSCIIFYLMCTFLR